MANNPPPSGNQQPPKGEYYTFDEVLKELQLDNPELQRLVSDGEIRAFREGANMKFRRTDIEGLKKGKMTEPTIVLPTEQEGFEQESQVLVVSEDSDHDNSNIDANELPMEDSAVMTDEENPIDDNEQHSEIMLVLDEKEHADKPNNENLLIDDPPDHNLDGTSSSVSSSGELFASNDSGKIEAPTMGEHKDTTQELQYEDESYASTALAKDDDNLSNASQTFSKDEDFDPSASHSVESEMKFEEYESATGQTEPLNNFLYETPKKKSSKESTPSEDESLTEPLQSPVNEAPAHKITSRRVKTGKRQMASQTQEVFGPISVFLLVAATIVLLLSGLFVINAIFDVDHPGTAWLTDAVFQNTNPIQNTQEYHQEWRGTVPFKQN